MEAETVHSNPSPQRHVQQSLFKPALPLQSPSPCPVGAVRPIVITKHCPCRDRHHRHRPQLLFQTVITVFDTDERFTRELKKMLDDCVLDDIALVASVKQIHAHLV